MGVLILLSALFSGSEAALFSILERDRSALGQRGWAGRTAVRLLDDPERLLSAVLFWNLLINMTYFGIAAIVGGRLEGDVEGAGSTAIVFTVFSLLAIIFFSEMLPKSIAVLAPQRIAVLVSPPLVVAIRIVSPILPLVKSTNQAAARLIWPTFQPEPEIDLADIERAIELGTEDAVLIQRERTALRGLVELAETRVDELMRPRSKLTIVSGVVDSTVLSSGMPPGGYLMIGDEAAESIFASVAVRHLRPSQLDDLDAAQEPVIYVPWSAVAARVWDELEQNHCSVAVVVNEFGDTVGAVTIDDILRGVLISEVSAGSAANINELPGGICRVSGSVALRSLAKRLGIDSPGERNATVAGYLQRCNERYPRVGDDAPLGDFRLTVAEETDDGVIVDVVAADPGISAEVSE